MLSGEELLHSIHSYTGLPDKGGQKDYAPDGSWLDDKRLQSYYTDRRATLQQERIRSVGGLAPAQWIPEQQRVKLVRNGKFIKTMGYVEDGSFYLLPEEALFLMDEGSILVTYGGVTLSIEEGYRVLLGSTVSLEQYQVFAYFTRLGYILRRHAGPSDSTRYEKQLKLDKYKRKRSKRSRDRANSHVTAPSRDPSSSHVTVQSRDLSVEEQCGEPAVKQIKVECGENEDAKLQILPETKPRTVDEDIPRETEHTNRETECDVIERDAMTSQVNVGASKSNSQESDNISKESEHSDTKTDNRKTHNLNLQKLSERTSCSNSFSDSNLNLEQTMETDQVHNRREHSIREVTNISEMDFSSKTNTASKCSEQVWNTDLNRVDKSTSNFDKLLESLVTRYSSWNFDEINIPDISNCKHVCTIQSKAELLLPNNIPNTKQEYIFNLMTNKAYSEVVLEFSQGSVGSKARLNARNWAEYKRQLAEISLDDSLLTSPVGYLWQEDDVTPLIQPHEANSTASILHKLKIIENVNVSVPCKRAHKVESTQSDVTTPSIVYDGYMPNSNFTKSNPGIPQYRLVIGSQDEPMPDLRTLGDLTSQSNTDDVTLIWAIVQGGDISFFSFNGVDLPQTVSLG